MNVKQSLPYSVRIENLTMKCLLVFLCLLTGGALNAFPALQNLRNLTLQQFLSLSKLIADSARSELQDRRLLRSSYDFIIIGAGSAGCTLANRLSENPKWNVLLIEAGDSENFLMDVPMLVHYLQETDVNWGYKTERSDKFCLGMKNNQCNWPRGKVMGGSSVLNYMVYTRGNRKDFENWSDLGNPGWDYENVTQYFRKLENNIVPSASPNYRGKGGPVTVSNIPYKSASASAFVRAGVEKGYNYVDYNGPKQVGFAYLQATVKDGKRQSTNVAYLYPIKGRKNLHVKKNSHVTKLLIDNSKNVYGVQFISRGRTYSVNTTKEVILSAGAINSPQILMLSGIGPSKHLKQLGINPVMNSAVGYNLMDHTSPGPLIFTVNTTTITSSLLLNTTTIDNYLRNFNGPFGSAGALEALAFIDTQRPKDPDGYPDVEFMHFGGAICIDPVLKNNFGLRDEIYDEICKSLAKEQGAFMVLPMVLRPKSRGRIRLRSKNPFEYPIIQPNYFSDHHDIEISVRAIRAMIDLLDTNALHKLNATFFNMPICEQHLFGSDDYWECYTRQLTLTVYHYCGTVKMGPSSDKRAVVDPTLKVYGVNNLRVADASIMPEITTGHTNSPTIMIGEKAADMIKETWML